MTDNEKYLTLMLAKLLYAMKQKEAGLDGNWGHPTLYKQLEDMIESIEEIECVKNAPRYFQI